MAGNAIRTDRLELRLPVESDRARFVELFCRDDFMEFSGGTMTDAAANERFDAMLRDASDMPFAKQPVRVQGSAEIVGYCGFAWFEFEGRRRLEFGYRLDPEARGRGYATEAGRALIDLASESFTGEVLAMIDPTNEPSQRVAAKLGFEFWKMATVNGFVDQLHRRSIGRWDRRTGGTTRAER